MKYLIELTDTLFAVIVPQEAYNFGVKHYGVTMDRSGTAFLDWLPGNHRITAIGKERDFFAFLGTIDNNEDFTFDCELYVEQHEMGYGYKDYYYPDSKAPLSSKEDSFLTLLDSKGLDVTELAHEKVLIVERLIKKTSEEWPKLLPDVIVTNIYGWDSSMLKYLWSNELITEKEYKERLTKYTTVVHEKNNENNKA